MSYKVVFKAFKGEEFKEILKWLPYRLKMLRHLWMLPYDSFQRVFKAFHGDQGGFGRL